MSDLLKGRISGEWSPDRYKGRRSKSILLLSIKQPVSSPGNPLADPASAEGPRLLGGRGHRLPLSWLRARHVERRLKVPASRTRRPPPPGDPVLSAGRPLCSDHVCRKDWLESRGEAEPPGEGEGEGRGWLCLGLRNSRRWEMGRGCRPGHQGPWDRTFL